MGKKEEVENKRTPRTGEQGRVWRWKKKRTQEQENRRTGENMELREKRDNKRTLRTKEQWRAWRQVKRERTREQENRGATIT